MTDDTKEEPKQDWNKLAQDALDLWQSHLNNLANDPKVKDDMVRMVTPMAQMFNQWTSMMQNNLQDVSTFMNPGQKTEDNQRDASASTSPSPTPSDPPVTAEAKDTHQEASVDEPTAPDTAAPTVAEPEAIAPVVASASDAAPDTNKETPVASAQPATRGRAASPDGPRDLAQLASRLAELERELDKLRPAGKQRARDESASDADDDRDLQPMAGADKSAASS